MASVGSFTTEDLLGWFSSLAPSSAVPRRPGLINVPPPGAVEHQFRLQQQEAARREQEEKEDYRDPILEEAAEYVPDYNTAPDDEKAFDYQDEYGIGPGNPTNPNAQPGDYDYAVNQSTDVYEEFDFDVGKNPALPILEYKEEILQAIESGQVSFCLLLKIITTIGHIGVLAMGSLLHTTTACDV